MSDSLRSLTKNERPWANRSSRSPKMSKWANRSFFLSESLTRSFFRIKRGIRSENRWANSQPCTVCIAYKVVYLLWLICWKELCSKNYLQHYNFGGFNEWCAGNIPLLNLCKFKIHLLPVLYSVHCWQYRLRLQLTQVLFGSKGPVVTQQREEGLTTCSYDNNIKTTLKATVAQEEDPYPVE